MAVKAESSIALAGFPRPGKSSPRSLCRSRERRKGREDREGRKGREGIPSTEGQAWKVYGRKYQCYGKEICKAVPNVYPVLFRINLSSKIK